MLIQKAQMTKKWATACITKHRFPKGFVDVEFDDGIERMTIQALLIHIPYFELCNLLEMPLLKKYIFTKTGPYNNKIFSSSLTAIYADFLLKENFTKKDIQNFKHHVWETINYLQEFGNMELAEHHCGISIVELAEIATHEKVKPIINVDLKSLSSTVQIEKVLDDCTVKLLRLLKSRTEIPNNVLQPYLEADVLNYAQVSQVMIAFGPSSEINDTVIGRPVYGSALSGMKDVTDAIIEHQKARKSVYYNKEAIRTSQYSNRKYQLLACSVDRLYEKPCTSKSFITLKLTPTIAPNCMGKYILGPEGKLIPLIPSNIEQYIDKTVQMRSAITCGHTDGVCEVCMGQLSRNLTPGMNIGFNAATSFVSKVTQLILKTKHIGQTKSKLYVVPQFADEYFESGASGVYVCNRLRAASNMWYMGIPHSCMRGGLSDLHSLDSEDTLSIPEERLSTMTHVFSKDTHGNVTPIILEADDQSPFLTVEFLHYMKSRYAEIVQDETAVWVPMDTCKATPVFRTTINTASMMGFVKLVVKFLESGKLTRYKDASAALQDFSELCFGKVTTHISHLEIMLKAHLIAGKNDWSIPVVSDPTKVMFGKTVMITQNRTLAQELALQGHKRMFASAKTYVSLKEQGPFDVYFDIS